VSKREAEDGLRQLATETGMEVVILRPPLVYGPGVGGNFLRLLSLVDRGFPLPLRLVDNRRSLIHLGNLIDAIKLCISHPKAAGKTFLVSDSEDVSTPELIRRLAEVLGRPARLLPFPQTLIRIVGKLFGKSIEVDRLLGSLVIDSTKIRNELDWKPRYSMAHGLAETAAWYRRKVNSV
jgi:nucleoside-diphosphate-sugar epimerase